MLSIKQQLGTQLRKCSVHTAIKYLLITIKETINKVIHTLLQGSRFSNFSNLFIRAMQAQRSRNHAAERHLILEMT